eukprot:TRINITY_DN9854_c0_g1_i1.p1 TRINITY_DN9854_c0_g1~~TRINITY_DN9854_c0_g1_i1.p1  ORF type:complete len:409 (+),score=113.14 TRINITY_DN9854_c0_g1_i1:170-1396(+)
MAALKPIAAVVGAFLIRNAGGQVPLANNVAPAETQAAMDAHSAREAAESAQDAAALANKVAQHSVKAAQGAHSALKRAQNVLHAARTASVGLSPVQQQRLASAEAHLVSSGEALKGSIEKPANNELKGMRKELRTLRKQLKDCENGQDKSLQQMDSELRELQGMLKSLEKEEKKHPASATAHSELKLEIEHLRESIDRLEKFGDHSAHLPKTVEQAPGHGELRYRMRPRDLHPKVQLTPLSDEPVDAASGAAPAEAAENVVAEVDAAPQEAAAGKVASETDASPCSSAAPCSPRALDIDTQMPYGELEAFGREDTAQELTEASIKESDAMVDQLERAEVAEEKRAVFRALTRLRGAAITSFDGVARSQTGNIDEYNKVHKWRSTHPLRHLADEESDISKWAFPDNADF